MKLFILVAAHLLSLSTTIAGAAVQRRQASCDAVSQYFKEVTTALFAVNYLRDYVHPCDQNLIVYFDALGLDGEYAVDTICIYDEGTPLFNNVSLDVVNAKIVVAWVGLFAATYSTETPARNLSCAYLDTSVLDELELDSVAIKNIICDPSPCTNTTITSSMSTLRPTGSVSTSCASSSVSGTGSISTQPPSSSVSGSGSVPTRPPSSSVTGSVTGSASSSGVSVSSSSGWPACSSSTASSTGSLSNSVSLSSSGTGSVSSTSSVSSGSMSSSTTGSVTNSISNSVSSNGPSGSQSLSTNSITNSFSGSTSGVSSSSASSGPPTVPSSITYYM